MKAIQTRYHGPTNTKGSRISATAEGVGGIMRAMYRMTLKNGDHFDLSASGAILYDGTRSLEFSGESWRILGFSTRHNAHRIIPIEAASRGESIGQGWIHDLDHGTHRLWGSPSYRRAVKVVRL